MINVADKKSNKIDSGNINYKKSYWFWNSDRWNYIDMVLRKTTVYFLETLKFIKVRV